jgi:shikimate kinase
MIQLIGPGGAGKSTVGAALATHLGLSFVDLDQHLAEQVGDIGAYMNRVGYERYASANVAAYCALLTRKTLPGVLALSSGFMTYADDVQPGYRGVRCDIERSWSTFVLVPSTDLETCVAETVRRQVGRRFGRSVAREEEVIRRRFPVYLAMAAPKVETMRSVRLITTEIVALMALSRFSIVEASARGLEIGMVAGSLTALAPDAPSPATTGREPSQPPGQDTP